MSPDQLARRARAAARAKRVVIRKGRLGEPELDFDPISGAAAISLLTQLSVESFSLSRRDSPKYSRKDIPVHFVPRSRS